MGGTNWSDSLYTARAKTRAATGTPTFAFDHYSDKGVTAYDADVKSGVTPDMGTAFRAAVAAKTKLHPKLDPKGIVFRECRDSDVHPESVPVAILLDVTGSMRHVPSVIQQKLPTLLGLLIRKSYLEHPAIQIVALGDATCDTTPLQVGQFEAGIELEDDLTNLFLEGGGGGQNTESYELALHFVDKHTVTDHWEKRGSRGYLFVIGDENPYPALKTVEVERIIGEKLGEPRTIEQIIESLRERWEIFFVNPNNTSNFKAGWLKDRWEKLLPQRVIYLEDPSTICEAIAAQIGIFEERADDVTADLVDVGADKSAAASVSRALVAVGAADKKAKGSVQKIKSSGAPSGVKTF